MGDPLTVRGALYSIVLATAGAMGLVQGAAPGGVPHAMGEIPWISWTGLLAMIGAAFGYGVLHGRLKAREEAETKVAKATAAELKFLHAVVLRLAYAQGVDVSDLLAGGGSPLTRDSSGG